MARLGALAALLLLCSGAAAGASLKAGGITGARRGLLQAAAGAPTGLWAEFMDGEPGTPTAPQMPMMAGPYGPGAGG
ncbi:MAG: hypothetical protein J3K34DRAFT_438971, partial [Monoraphidium minutum]